ncbi:hypothetical protein BKA65DRAFT_517378 [Rhexocercosporidium sp. MPI-PUGE-AT-0058]|nr:hypothetical protein BKA65DRAFT_517378 [Rhexocercosporidium sp. MPI-PUGE-AT-0058]
MCCALLCSCPILNSALARLPYPRLSFPALLSCPVAGRHHSNNNGDYCGELSSPPRQPSERDRHTLHGVYGKVRVVLA